MIDAFAELELLAHVDVQFARLMARAGAPPWVALGAAFASHALTSAHICADLRGLADRLRDEVEGWERRPDAAAALALIDALPDADAWAEALRASPLVRDENGPEKTPLVLFDGALYLDRYWTLQARLVDTIAERLPRWSRVDPALLRADLDRLFPPNGSLDRQRLAALLAATRPFTVVVGGPGTGKTHTVVKMLALLLSQARAAGGPTPRIRLLAPTGKAAARMAESVRRLKDALALDADLRAQIPDEASTIHRALGAAPHRPLKHDRDNPLHADVVIVDEASMVDLAMMSRLFEAVPREAHLVLLGDRDQLASVEAGAVLGDICAAGQGYSTKLAGALERMDVHLPPALVGGSERLGIGDATVELTHTWRFAEHSGIRKLASAINAGAADEALAVLADPAYPDVGVVTVGDADALHDAIGADVCAGYRGLGAAPTPAVALASLGRLRVLCVHRDGARGVGWTNQQARRWLAAAGHVDPDATWYRGRPVMVTRNDRALGLFNGDVGVVHDGQVWFPTEAGPRGLSPGRLPRLETVYATTVHKSQGSEFAHVIVVLPERASRICTRAMLYTAVTRATDRVTIVSDEAALRSTIGATSVRASGLRALLEGLARRG